MADRADIKKIVDAAVSHVLKGHIPQLQQELSERVLEQLRPELAAAPQPAAATDGLLKSVCAIHAGTTQKEVLRALLDNIGDYCGRAAIFVIKAGAAAGWEARGFADNADIKDFALNAASGPAAEALKSRNAASGTMEEIDPRLGSQFGAPADDRAMIIPLILKEKVAALLYADGGEGKAVDFAALELLVRATGAWLEVALLRKQVAKDGGTEAPEVAQTGGVQTVTSFSDPFAGHAPLHTAKPEIPAEEAVSAAPVASAGAGEAAASPEVSPEDADTHRKAQRFARLLVDEIKLYNQAKVAEGRKNKDLYDRLKEDIDKSRSTYQKRYGSTAAATGDYFNGELVRSLAEDDIAIMGSSFRR